MSSRRSRRRAILSILSIIFLVVLIFITWFDWNMFKPFIERQVTEKTGREFVIQGDLDVDLSMNPRISAEGISLANADWSTEQPMLSIGQLAFRISLWDFLAGDIVLPEVSVFQSKTILEISADGKRNWELKKEEKETELPKIGRLTLDDGVLIFRDPEKKTDITARISTDASEDAGETPLKVKAKGTFTELKFTAQAEAGGVNILTDETIPYPIKASVEIGTTRAKLDGAITGVAKPSRMGFNLDMNGDDLSALYPIVGIVIFPSPPYRISGKLLYHDNLWSMTGFSGKVGESDLGGAIVLDTSGKRPMLRGELISNVLDLHDMQGFVGARRAPQPQDTQAEKEEKEASLESQKHRLLPDEKFKVDRLRAMDADVRFTGESFRNKELPVEHLVAHLKIDDGLMTLSPADFAVAGGHIKSNLTINARGDIPTGEVRVDVKRLQLPKLFPKIKLIHSAEGVIGGATNLKARGESVGALLGSANGRFGLIMSGGEISELVLGAIDLDAAVLLKALFAGDKNVPVRCAVIDSDVTEGIMTTDAFVIDTEETNILGEGQISLAEETIKMKLSPQPKQVSFPTLRTPVHIAGTFRDPIVYPDKVLAMRVAASVVLGVLATPFAALIPLIETGPGEDTNCGALIESVKQPRPPKQSRLKKQVQDQFAQPKK
ncbi:MAG TPA: AsmA family protein [Nitrosospira sp.]